MVTTTIGGSAEIGIQGGTRIENNKKEVREIIALLEKGMETKEMAVKTE